MKLETQGEWFRVGDRLYSPWRRAEDRWVRTIYKNGHAYFEWRAV